MHDRIAQTLTTLPAGAGLAVSGESALDRRHVFFHHAGDALSIETSDATTDYRLDVPVGPGADAGLDEEQASTLASHGVGALAAIGGAASHTWRLERYA